MTGCDTAPKEGREFGRRCLAVHCGKRRQEDDESWRTPWWDDWGTCSGRHAVDYYGDDIVDHEAFEDARRATPAPVQPAATGDDGEEDDRGIALMDRAAGLLAEIYEPAGVLMFWSSRITYLDYKRPCDLWLDCDYGALDRLCDRLDALADGAFL